jgi:tetratricopeptide (TPR) repeat protein
MEWEDLAVPFNITVDNPAAYYIDELRIELKGNRGFEWSNLAAAARYALDNKMVLPEALEWARRSAQSTSPGQENYTTLTTLADLLDANGQQAEAAKVREKALNLPSTSAMEMHLYARSLLNAGKKQEALSIWQLNAKRHGSEWPVNVGLARGYSAAGNYKEALKYAKLALAQAPDEANRKGLQAAVTKLEAGKDMN